LAAVRQNQLNFTDRKNYDGPIRKKNSGGGSRQSMKVVNGAKSWSTKKKKTVAMSCPKKNLQK